MAYKGAYNPDALPAHAEPEQVAQMLGAMTSRQDSNQERPPMPPPKNGPLPQQPRLSPSHNPEPPHSQIPAQHSYARAGSGGGPGVVPPGAVSAAAGHYRRGGAPAPNPNTTGRLHSPPPQNYGFGPPPAHPAQNRPPPTCRPPRSPQPSGPGMPQSDDPNELFPLFRAANASNSGALSEIELGSAW
ncbi:hypothetical protein ACJ72_07501 [Emergomyces africanus]|uniref:EF-hand domain-containing protein n=1 Tax=Emergomyces africanus TaxID=1955775 RepID=A0A1B7NN22_9EURO|nr:hypothetical protein ACJ72_07501 [Emergomyces africanus]